MLYYIVTFKTDDGNGGYGGTHERDFNTREEAEAFATDLADAGDAYDIEIEEIEEAEGEDTPTNPPPKGRPAWGRQEWTDDGPRREVEWTDDGPRYR